MSEKSDSISTSIDTDLSNFEKKKKYKKKMFPPGIDYSKLLLSIEGLYSLSHWKDSEIIINKIKDYFKNYSKLKITDSTAGMGGNTIMFAKYFNNINAVEINKNHMDCLLHNCKLYHIDNNISFTLGDYNKYFEKLDQDIIFIDPPWGGPEYKKKDLINLYLSDTNIKYISKKIIEDKLAKLLIIKIKFNFDFLNFYADLNIIEKELIGMKKYYVLFIKI